MDGEGSFIITHHLKVIKFPLAEERDASEGGVRDKLAPPSEATRFHIYLHKDDTNMLNYIARRLKVGSVHVGNRFTSYVVKSQSDLLKSIKIFDKIRLNTSKNLNFLMFKKGSELYFNRTTFRVPAEIHS